MNNKSRYLIWYITYHNTKDLPEIRRNENLPVNQVFYV